MKKGKSNELSKCVDRIFKGGEDRGKNKVTFGMDFDGGFGFGMGFFLAGSIYMIGWMILWFFLIKSAIDNLLP